MRPLRFLLSLATCIIAFFLLLNLGPWHDSTQEDLEERNTIGAYFNWRTPSSLFPPSAIISLTDDNSTFFLARPAAFGPLLPSKSLSGQLWVGSGFGDDHLRGGAAAGAEGELGCSDIPDWNDGSYRANALSGKKGSSELTSNAVENQDGKSGKGKRSFTTTAEGTVAEVKEGPDEADGTDDHLHHPLSPSDGFKTNGESAGNSKKPAHADIQSLQEGAEIAGKVVLLSRGGCGFLEKVKWVQRRGGVALIVGDDIRGGPLVTMYARGDTSNVTIPSLFTSHTTAHLLSSLIPSGGVLDDLSAEEAARFGLALGDRTESKPSNGKQAAVDKPNFTTTSVAVKTTSTLKAQHQNKIQKPSRENTEDDEDSNDQEKVGWFRSLFSSRRAGSKDSRRPPSSGKVNWVLQEDFREEDDKQGRIGKQPTSSVTSSAATTKKPSKGSGDGFVIGVQDWRDPDMVAEQKERLTASTVSASLSSSTSSSNAAKSTGLKGGSITPGSGEYGKPAHEAVDLVSWNRQSSKEGSSAKHDENREEGSEGWLSRLFGSHKQPPKEAKPAKEAKDKAVEPVFQPSRAHPHPHAHIHATDENEHYDGLWVTLTPTSVSSSPFFDTLLVLVVSPLVTLTVVYALLLLRSRIRRRRWRAPKSVVERLPVRTYQTMPSTTATSSATSSISMPISASTPLLPSAARPINARARPRSRTASEIPVQPSSSLRSDGMASPSLEQVEEKRAAGLAEWKKKYGGKQRECVVCLEEYVDGVSRVMSLPCGHEFHAECITPWLTTRRRTCPICKGDVVRSLARSANSTSSSTPPQPYHDSAEDEEDVQEQAAVSRNDDPVAQQPVSREDEAFEDLERGVGVDRTR